MKWLTGHFDIERYLNWIGVHAKKYSTPELL